MADSLLAARGAGKVGEKWPSTFVHRRPELRTQSFRKYDHQRAKCEDPEVIGNWFKLVSNIKGKYGIVDEDTYNFDETGFQMGVISSGVVVTGSERRGRPLAQQPGNREWVTSIMAINAMGRSIPPFIIFGGKYHLSSWYEEPSTPRDWVFAMSENGWTNNELGVKWLQHFDKHTKGGTVGEYRLLIIDGHESHDSLAFRQLCEESKIITLCMPPHSSHKLQPLDVGCFSPLKKAYGKEIEHLIRLGINHITKDSFLPAFQVAVAVSITKGNIEGSFRGAGLVPFDPERVLSTLDIQLRTPTPPTIDNTPWESRTPSNFREFESQSALLRDRIQNHPLSSPTEAVVSLEKLSKGIEMIAHGAELMRSEVADLRKANEAASKRKSRKRKLYSYKGSSPWATVAI